jgi:DNA-binding winged helix-turn-helix (wHTH) protein
MVEGEVSFGRFRLDLARRELRRDETPVRLGSRALDILCVLASAEGRVVTKDELMARVWAGVIVEEHNIQVHISALRKAFEEGGDGESWIVTVPGRGYRLLRPREPPAADDPAPGRSFPVADKPSLAVLPFLNPSGDPEQEYFADGMVEEITTALSRIRWLFVTARTSTFTYKGQNVDVKRVGRELGVRYVLEGLGAQERQSGPHYLSVDRCGYRGAFVGRSLRRATGRCLRPSGQGRFERRRRHRARLAGGGSRTFDRSPDDRPYRLRPLFARSDNGLVVGTANPGGAGPPGAGDHA